MSICRIIENRESWNQFVAKQEKAQFLQSWEWGEFQKKMGRRVWRVGIFEDGLIGAVQIIEHYLGLGLGYLYCPRGPIIDQVQSSKFKVQSSFDFIKEKIANYGHIFFRVEPTDNIQYPISNIQFFRVPSIQPSHTLVLDLLLSGDGLFNQMHPKTRYNIRLAEKKGLKFRIMNWELGIKKEDFESFWLLLRETAKRDKIRLHPRKYYELMNKTLSAPNSNIQYSIFNIQYFNQWLAAGIFLGFGDTFSYGHGASSSQHREMMASHLLHWEAIKFAKLAGYRYYDFGGVNPENNQDFDYRKSWEGITRFKKGFASGASPNRSVGSGRIINYPGTFNIVLNKLGYKIYQLARKIRRM